MRAVVHDKYGPPEVLRLEDVERPEPKDDEVLVKVHATTVNRTDCHLRGANPFLWRLFGAGFLRPKQRMSGSDLAGEVVEVGAAVTEFAVGDHVFGTSGYRFGAHAEFICVRETALIAHKPAELSFEQAAAIADGALPALASLRRMGLREARGSSCTARPGQWAPEQSSSRSTSVPTSPRCAHEERRARAIARRRQGRRLHAGGLHQERRDVRCRARRGSEALVQAVA